MTANKMQQLKAEAERFDREMDAKRAHLFYDRSATALDGLQDGRLDVAIQLRSIVRGR